MKPNLIFFPSFSLEPNKLTSYNSVFISNSDTGVVETFQERSARIKKSRLLKSDSQPLKKSFHNFTISDNAYRTLKRKINWLYYLAKSKNRITSNGKQIFNFKIAFMTFTLPSAQKSPTNVITSQLFNQLLTELRTEYNMCNYVWRLEFQQNKNVHYHLVTDTYVDYFELQKRWNRILYKHGYVQEYQKKFSAMTLNDYFKYSTRFKVKDFKEVAQTYFKAKAVNWSQPPTVDVKSVISNKAISNYISKYFAKDAKNEVVKNDLDNEDNSKSLRLWYCSRSLSKLNSISDFCERVEYDVFSLVKTAKNLRTHFAKYATSFYFKFADLSTYSRVFIEKLLRKYAYDGGYIAAS